MTPNVHAGFLMSTNLSGHKSGHKNMMLDMVTPEIEVVVKNHAADCPFRAKPTSLALKKCRCPKYLYVARQRLRISARTRSWDAAEELAKNYVKPTEAQPTTMLLASAIDKFYEHLRVGDTGEKVIANIKADCKALATYIANQNRQSTDKILSVHEITSATLTDWMASWKGRPKLDKRGQPTTRCTLATKQKKQKHIRRFFRYCVAQKWTATNPANDMPKIGKRNHESAIPKIPFTAAQMTSILLTAANYHNKKRALLAHALIHLMRRSGLAIADATLLERTRLHADNRLEMYRTKTGEDVYLPLPNELASELRALAPKDSRYFFWNGVGKWESAANGWGKVLRRIFADAKIKLQDRNGNPLLPSSHFFRNTFAKEILETGKVGVEDLATLLGDDPETVREYYAKWCPGLQNKLDDAVRNAWAVASASADTHAAM
jgi:site-specific recombinase XerD